jgi:CBS domain-containing membrane protein
MMHLQVGPGGLAREGHHRLLAAPAGVPDTVRAAGGRLGWGALERYHRSRLPLGCLALANGAVFIGVMGLAAWLTHQPLVFPSLGPTAFLLIYRPRAEASCPRNALVGHLIGALAGLAALAACGLLDQGPDLERVSFARVLAATMSLGLTAAVMVWAGTPHPPAGATTLIVSLGFLHTPTSVGILMLGVVLLLIQGFAVNRWVGIDYPLWGPRLRERPSAPTSDRQSSGPTSGGDHVMQHSIYIDSEGEPPATDAAFDRLRAILGDQVREFAHTPREWTGVVTVEAPDLDEAALRVRLRVDEADAAAGLRNWRCSCWALQETMIPVDSEVPMWHPHLPHPHLPHPHLPHPHLPHPHLPHSA